jgi:hypothetical protein
VKPRCLLAAGLAAVLVLQTPIRALADESVVADAPPTADAPSWLVRSPTSLDLRAPLPAPVDVVGEARALARQAALPSPFARPPADIRLSTGVIVLIVVGGVLLLGLVVVSAGPHHVRI